MIERDQPVECPKDKLIVVLSSVEDGTMTKSSLPENIDQVIENRDKFIKKAEGDLAHTALVYVTFDTDDYCRYREVDSKDLGLNSIKPADALVTRSKEVGIFLPLADCCGVVIYDQAKDILMVSHIGRQSVEQLGGLGSVKHLSDEYDSDPNDLYIWLSPAAGSDNYPIYKRDDGDLQNLIIRDLVYGGVPYNNIEISSVDTTKNTNYYSHSEHIKGNRSGINGRFAIYASMKSLDV